MKTFFLLTVLFGLTVFNVSAQESVDSLTFTTVASDSTPGASLSVSVLPPEINSFGAMPPELNTSLAASIGLQDIGATSNFFADIGQLSLNYDNSQSTLTIDTGSIPSGTAGYEFILNLKSSTANLEFSESQPISVFDLENDYTLIQSDGTNTTTQTGTIASFEVTVAPEPSTWAMLFCGVAAWAFYGRRLRKPLSGK